jgi:hypothetical protein
MWYSVGDLAVWVVVYSSWHPPRGFDSWLRSFIMHVPPVQRLLSAHVIHAARGRLGPGSQQAEPAKPPVFRRAELNEAPKNKAT